MPNYAQFQTDPMAGINQGLAGLGQSLVMRQQMDRQAALDKINATSAGLQQSLSQMGIDEATARKNALIQAMTPEGGAAPTYEQAIGLQMKNELALKEQERRSKMVNDTMSHVKALSDAGMSPENITSYVRGVISKNPDMGLDPNTISFTGKEFEVLKNYNDNEVPDLTQPGKFLPAGKYKVKWRPTGDPQQPLKPVNIELQKDDVLSPAAEAQQIRIAKAKKGEIGAPNIPPITGGAAPGERNPRALEGASTGDQAIIKQLVDYKMPLPSGFALKSPYWQGILQRAALFDPSFDASQYNVRLKLRNDFASGKAGQNIRSLNTAVAHLGELKKAADALDNSSMPLWNKIANAGLTQTGDSRVTKFLSAATAVEGELANVFKNSGATDQEIKAWRQNLDSSQSPEQLKNNLNTVIDLLGGRLSALQSQYETGMGKPKDFKMLSDKSRKILSGIGINVDAIDPIINKSDVAGAQPANTPRNMTPAITWMKGFKDRQSAINGARQLISKGWTQQEVADISKQAGWQ